MPEDGLRRTSQTVEQDRGVDPAPVSWRSPGCLFALIGLVVTCIVTLGVLGFGTRTGDGSEYYLMMISWAEALTPYSTPGTGAVYNEYLNTGGAGLGLYDYEELSRRFARLSDTSGAMDSNHFWFYSLLAAVFYHPLKLAALNIGYSFTLLHLVLLISAFVLATKSQNCRTGLALTVLVLGSPAVWYLDKAHTELFTVITSTMAMACLLRRSGTHAALWFALAGTQNPPFSVVAIMALGMHGWWHGRRGFSSSLLPATGAVVLTAVHPAYYLWRHGVLTPQAGGHGATVPEELWSWKYLTYTWIDPDVGLLLNWIPALPLLIITVYLIASRRIKLSPVWLTFVAGVLLVFALSHAVTTNYNHGGTRSISRYALWYLFLFLPILLHTINYLSALGGVRGRAGLAVGAILFLLSAGHNWPGRGEGYLYHSPAATAIYRHAPAVYDPIPEIFEERTGNSWEGNGGARAWALSNESGQKILVYRDRLPTGDRPAPPVFGNPELSGERVRDAASRYFSSHPDRSTVYLNNMADRSGLFGP